MEFRPRSIRAKLLAVFMTAAVLPMGVLGVIFYNSSTKAVAEMVGNRTARLAQSVREELDRKLESRIQDRLLATNQPVQAFLAQARPPGLVGSAGSIDTLQRYLEELFVQYGDYYDELVLADPRGQPLLRFERSAGAVVAGPALAATALEGFAAGPSPGAAEGGPRPLRFGVLAPSVPAFRESDRMLFRTGPDLASGEHRLRADPVDGNRAPTLSILSPVQSNQQPAQRLGYLLARVRSQHLWPEDWANRRFGEHGHLVIFDAASGEVLYHTLPEWIGRPVRQVDPELFEAANAPQPARADAVPWTWVGGGAGRRVATVLEASNVPWKIVATATPGEFAIEARRAALFNLVVAGAALLAATALLVIASGRLSRSIMTLTAGARRIAGGDFGGPPIQAETHDEIQTLAEAFNVMSESVRRNIIMREQAAAELDALNRSLEGRVQARTRELEALNVALNRANEELKELDRLKSNFLATVSHEFKTPLTSIKAFAEILHDELEEQKAPGELKRFLRIIDAESDRLARLIKNVLDLSRIESGRMAWRMSDFPVSQMIEATIDGLLPAVREKKLQIERSLPPQSVELHGDQDRLQEVLTNVLDNAIKASSEGQRIVIGCREEPGATNGQPRTVRIFVRDQGHGIPPDQIEKIFDRFHQVTLHGKRRKGGTGLGLAISREITEYHGGRIWAESELGNGSTFHITLPIATLAGGRVPRADGPSLTGRETPREEADA